MYRLDIFHTTGVENETLHHKRLGTADISSIPQEVVGHLVEQFLLMVNAANDVRKSVNEKRRGI